MRCICFHGLAAQIMSIVNMKEETKASLLVAATTMANTLYQSSHADMDSKHYFQYQRFLQMIHLGSPSGKFHLPDYEALIDACYRYLEARYFAEQQQDPQG